MLQRLKAQVGKVNFNELYTLALLALGLPYICYIYFSWKEAVSVFIVTQIAIGLLSLREPK
jgi:hypothetical protein